MKKTALFLACCIGLMFFASCKKGEPTISIATGTQYVSQDTQVFSGDQITVGFSTTGENLTKIEMNAAQNGTVLYTDTQSIDNQSAFLYAHNFIIEAIGTVTITGIVTDAQGRTATKSFDIVCYEKPNAKFIGRYEGDALITGSYDAEISNMDPMHEDFVDQPFATVVDMASGDNINEVLATIVIEEQSNTVKGTVDGDKVTFEGINTTYNMTYQGVSVPLDMTYNIVGTLNNGKLDLEGDCQGSGEFNFYIVSGTVKIEGTIGGSLDKTR